MRVTTYVLVGVGLVTTLAGCSTVQNTGSQCLVPAGFFHGASTFSWRATPAIDVDDPTGFVSPVSVSLLEAAVTQELEAKGLSLVPGSADESWSDIEVAVSLRTRREVICMTADGFPCGRGDCRQCVDLHYPAEAQMRTVGFLAADIYFLGEPVWRGWVERDLYPADRDSPKAIAEAVPALFETFPP